MSQAGAASTGTELEASILSLLTRIRELTVHVKPEMEEATRELVSLKEEYKTVTGSELSDLREEGPILLTTNKVRGREVLPELRKWSNNSIGETLLGEFQC